jgi:hypothetical protein
VRLLVRSGVQLGAVDARVVRAHATKSAGESAVANAGALHSEGLAHDGASAAEDLEVGHAARAGRDIVGGGGGGEGAERGGGRLVEEWTHGPRLAQEGLHVGQWVEAVGGVAWYCEVL